MTDDILRAQKESYYNSIAEPMDTRTPDYYENNNC